MLLYLHVISNNLLLFFSVSFKIGESPALIKFSNSLQNLKILHKNFILH